VVIGGDEGLVATDRFVPTHADNVTAVATAATPTRTASNVATAVSGPARRGRRFARVSSRQRLVATAVTSQRHLRRLPMRVVTDV